MKLLTRLLLACYISSTLSMDFAIPYEPDWITDVTNNELINFRRRDEEVKAKKCVCFDTKPSLTNVPDLVGSKESRLERLIVYLYRDNKTKDIIMYTPNVETQSQLPDLMFQPGDSLLKASHQIVGDIFEQSLNTVPVKNLKDQSNLSSYKLREDISKSGDPVAELAGASKQVLNSYDNLRSSTQAVPVLSTQTFASSTKGWPITDIQPSTNKSVSNKSHGDEIKARHVNAVNNSPLAEKSQSLHTENKTTSPVSKDDSFDTWFREQMKSVQNEEPIKSDTIDVNKLKKLIENTLINIGMLVSVNGTLTNSNGKVLDMSNLKLRPILIGGSFGFENMNQKAVNNKYTISQDKPFLESILITLMYPPQILGIIPLGRVNFPKETLADSAKLKNNTGASSGQKTYLKKVNKVKNNNRRIIPGMQTEENVTKKINIKKLGKEILKSIDTFDEDKFVDKNGARMDMSHILTGGRRYPYENFAGFVINTLKSMFSQDSVNEDGQLITGKGFRIIGGDPATISGQIVNNRGRSGFIL